MSEISNFVHWVAMSSISLRITNCPSSGRGYGWFGHVTSLNFE